MGGFFSAVRFQLINCLPQSILTFFPLCISNVHLPASGDATSHGSHIFDLFYLCFVLVVWLQTQSYKHKGVKGCLLLESGIVNFHLYKLRGLFLELCELKYEKINIVKSIFLMNGELCFLKIDKSQMFVILHGWGQVRKD